MRLGSNDFFFLSFKNEQNFMNILAQAAFVVNNSPALPMSSMKTTNYQRALIIPIHLYKDLIMKTFGFFDNDINRNYATTSFTYSALPIRIVLIKTSPNIDDKRIKELTHMFSSIYNFRVWTYQSEKLILTELRV